MNYCVSLLQKCNRDYYENLNIKEVPDNKPCVKQARILVFLTHILPYKDRVGDSALIREYTGRRKAFF